MSSIAQSQYPKQTMKLMKTKLNLLKYPRRLPVAIKINAYVRYVHVGMYCLSLYIK